MANQRSLGQFQAPDMGQPSMGTGLESLKAMIAMQAGLAGAGAKQQVATSGNMQGPPNTTLTKYNSPFGGQYEDQDTASRFTGQSLNSLQEAKQARSVLDLMENTANTIHGGRIQGTMKDISSEATGGAGADAPVKVYNDSMVAHAITLLKGINPGLRVTQAEAQNYAKPLLWQVNESDDVKHAKFQHMRDLMDNNIYQLSGGKEGNPITSPAGDTGVPQTNQSSPVPGMSQSNQSADSTGRIKVRNLANNQTGTISASGFDPKKYARL